MRFARRAANAARVVLRRARIVMAMETMDENGRRFLADVQARAGTHADALVEAATRSTLRALGGQLTHTPGPIADALGERLVRELEHGRKQSAVEPNELVAAVARQLRLRPSAALELCESVVAELAARVGPGGRDALRKLLPSTWADLVIDPRPASAQTHAPVPPRQVGADRTLAAAGPRRDTLATGKPGSKHPVAEND